MLMSCGFAWVVNWDWPLASDISDMLSTCRVVFRVWIQRGRKGEARGMLFLRWKLRLSDQAREWYYIEQISRLTTNLCVEGVDCIWIGLHADAGRRDLGHLGAVRLGAIGRAKLCHTGRV